MAEAVVSLAVERISDLLINEAVFLKGVSEEVERLKAELKRMQCFLKDTDRKQERDERLRNRVAEIRDLAYDAEDVIDSFIVKAARQGGFHGIINRFTSIFTNLSPLHKTGVQVNAIRTKLEDISKSLPAYDITGEGEGSSSISRMQQPLRRTYSHVEEEDAVSLEVSTKDVLAQLMTTEDRLHAVVSIVGMGGIGKTTVARKVYNHGDVRRHFDCLAWVFVSQQCKPREVLQDILIKVQGEPMDNLNQNQLIKRLWDVLKEKLYLVVLDDIWRSEDWESLKPGFPRGKKGSKILFTTRNKHVALLADPWHTPIELPLLTNDESWELLSRKAFQRNKIESDACLKEFEMLGREMVKKCGGLPLAVVVLGGLLATKQSRVQWEMVHRNIRRYLKGFQQQDHQYGAVNGILVLSYNDLPYYLKPCFLYLGHYPEDWEISKSELIRLWIAEGFISPSLESEGMMMEDVAEQFLEELTNRCLVQVGKRDYTGIGVKTCRMHDLLRDLCVDKAREENFLGIMHPGIDENNHSPHEVTLVASMPRRISVHSSKRYVRLKVEHPNLRSLLLFQNENLSEPNILKCKNFKFLRVLNLGRMGVNWHVSSEIGNLHHLRYLRLNCYKMILPRAIGKLKNLHTLRLEHRLKLVLPNVLFKLERLRYVDLRNYYSKFMGFNPLVGGTWLSPRCTSKNIETLKGILVDEKLIENNGVVRWTNIQSLGIVFKRSKDVKPILKSLVELHRLRSLRMLLLEDSIPYADLEPLSQSQRLSKLSLSGKIKEDTKPSHHVLKFLPPNIVKLTLSSSNMEQDPMVVLEKLPYLRILRLFDGAYKGSKLICSANGFLQLDSLQIFNFQTLEEWEIEEGAMPRLRSLYLGMISKLKMFPEGLQYITTLQEITLKGMRSSLVERIQVMDGREGDDFYKVSHIPSIRV